MGFVPHFLLLQRRISCSQGAYCGVEVDPLPLLFPLEPLPLEPLPIEPPLDELPDVPLELELFLCFLCLVVWPD